MKTLLAGAAIAVALASAPAAQADPSTFYSCGPGVGVAGEHTSCDFAYVVKGRYPFSTVAYGVILKDVYSPYTGQTYTMYCDPGTVTFSNIGVTVNSEICRNTTGAAVAVL